MKVGLMLCGALGLGCVAYGARTRARGPRYQPASAVESPRHDGPPGDPSGALPIDANSNHPFFRALGTNGRAVARAITRLGLTITPTLCEPSTLIVRCSC